MHASAPDAAPGTLQPKLAHASPYAPLDQDFIKYTQRARVALSMRNDDVSAPIHRSRRKFARASHQEPRAGQGGDAHRRCTCGCIHYHKTSGASTSGKSEPVGGLAKERRPTTKTPNPILDGFNGKHNILQVNIALARCTCDASRNYGRIFGNGDSLSLSIPGGPLPYPLYPIGG